VTEALADVVAPHDLALLDDVQGGLPPRAEALRAPQERLARDV
jgi:hypothetical protein